MDLLEIECTQFTPHSHPVSSHVQRSPRCTYSCNSDTPYSLAWVDLRAEPMVLSVPAMPADRYYSVMLCDGNTFNYGLFGADFVLDIEDSRRLVLA